MRTNLDLTGGLLMTEAVATRLDRPDAKAVVTAVAERASASGRPLRDELIDDDAISLTPDEIDSALDPTAYLGSAEAFVDRALEAHERSGDGG
jgi:3-carboxy-cis,cis-muconate cycloisomerase